MIAGREGGPGRDVNRAIAGRELELLRLLGINPTPERGGKHRRCPFPDHDDADPSWRWDPGKRRWYCSCAARGGTVLDAIMRMRGLDFAAAVALAREMLGLDAPRRGKGAAPEPNGHGRERAKGKRSSGAPVAEDSSDADAASVEAERREREETVAWVRAELAAAGPLPGTPGERYLVEHRGLRGPWPDALLYAGAHRSRPDAIPRPCLLAAVTDPAGEVVALHSVELDPRTGAKSARTDRPKRSRGPVAEGTVSLGEAGEQPSALVIGEGLETTLTRRLVGPCDAHACLGPLRFVEPRPHHRRVEILADNDGRERARVLARRYAALGLAAYVVTVPDGLGPKADLNDLLRELGPGAVQMAIEDAERIEPRTTARGRTEYDLELGSDVEIALRVLERLDELFGPVVVAEGQVWRFDRTHWVALDAGQLARLVHKADGAAYLDADGRLRQVRLNRSRVASVTDALLKYRQQPDYFAAPPPGINCASGFVRLAEDGTPEPVPHARRWRQRHVVKGRYPAVATDEDRANSLLAKYLGETFAGDADAEAKRELVGETLGAAAMGHGTRVRSPKAVVAYSEQGATGKSVYLELLRALPNPEAVASVPPGKFGDEKYAYRLIAKVLNAADELPDRAVRSDVFKRMVTGEPVPARDLYRSATDFRPTALHVFSTNVLPSFQGGVDGGLVRRLLPVGFNRVVPEGERDPDLARTIVEEEADLLLELAVDGASRLLRRRDFTVPASSRELLLRWTLWADPVRAWAAERLEVTAGESRVAVATLYADFARWAEAGGVKAEFLPNAIGFGKRLKGVRPELEHLRSDGSFYRNARIRRAPEAGP